MYLPYYNLKKQPFHITPDPEFLYLSPSHKEALAGIIYGIEQRKGFIAIIGAVGVGKTTILRSYLEGADRSHLKIIYVFHANLSFEGLIRTIYQELGVPAESDDVLELVNKLYEILIEEYKQGATVVLVIDEAQNMPVDTLENLRMLSNLETSKDKLIQIVLVGQPEFEEKLNLNVLRQLKQRLAVRSTILPLTKQESMEYIKFRLQKAGSNSRAVFTASALKKISSRAKGVPRVINILCDNSLITGFGYQKKPVPAKIVKEIIRDLDGKRRSSVARWWILGVSSVVALLAGITWFFLPHRATVAGEFETQHRTVHKESADVPREATESEKPTEGGDAQQASPATETPTTPPVKSDPRVLRKIVARGDTLIKLAQEVYGNSDASVIRLIQEGNPHITDPNVIPVGITITFPTISELGKRVDR